MASFKVCTQLRVWTYADRFLLEPLDGSLAESLVLDRASGVFSLTSAPPDPSAAKGGQFLAFGVLGGIKLLAGYYLVVITGRELVGSFRGEPVYRVRDTKVLSCSPALSHLSNQQRKDELHFRNLLKVGLSSHGLFYSGSIDITNTTQEYEENADKHSLPLWQQADTRFFWNKHLLSPLLETGGLDSFALPVMQGSFQKMEVEMKGKLVTLVLIARRSVYRAGTRMWRRGADEGGAVANFVETEQLVSVGESLASYVQIRGSMPIFWEQIVDLTYKPKMKPIAEQGTYTEKHFNDLKTRYREVVALDLVNQKGGEGVLGSAYGEAVSNLKDDQVRYEAFDFHKVCGHTRFDRLSLLYDKVSDSIQKFGYLLVGPSGEKLKQQKGVARTNCIDCLDRTNVTQSLLGRRALETQLHSIGLFEEGETVVQHPDFDVQYKILWANHGDDISIQYTGTGALKGDFVRYGKRSYQGLLQDGQNAMMRYYLNNFRDGTRQDAYDLIMGYYQPDVSKPSPFARKGLERILVQRLAFGFLFVGTMMTTVALLDATKSQTNALFALFWAGFSFTLFWFVKRNGRTFTDRPRLCKLR